MLGTGTGLSLFTTIDSSPNASWTGSFGGGDAERCYRRVQAEARLPLAGPRRQDSPVDIEHGQPPVSVDLVGAGILGARERAFQDSHFVLQPVRH